MKAEYIIITGRKGLTFKAPPLSFKKCLQIKRIAMGQKKWKGYHLRELEFGGEGLKRIKIARHEKTSNKKPNKHYAAFFDSEYFIEIRMKYPDAECIDIGIRDGNKIYKIDVIDTITKLKKQGLFKTTDYEKTT